MIEPSHRPEVHYGGTPHWFISCPCGWSSIKTREYEQAVLVKTQTDFDHYEVYNEHRDKPNPWALPKGPYTLEDYAFDAARTAPDVQPDARILLAALGMCGEAGEFADIVKKIEFHGHPLNRNLLIKEAGDVLWYVAAACRALDVTLEEVARKNIEKLRERYPEGFSSTASLNRKEEA